MPVAVNDLERAQADFRRLGFVLKPGRHHADGIRNAHVKFANGTEIELMTAAAAKDALSAEYVAWLKGGDGAAFWSLYSPHIATLTGRLAALGLAPVSDGDIVTFSQAAMPHRLFFADRLPSPTDRPGYFDHPNSANRLAAVWLYAAPAEQSLLLALGAYWATGPVCAPFAAFGRAMPTAQGDEIVILPAAPGRDPSRAIVAVTLRVRSLQTARTVLRANHVGVVEAPSCPRHELWVQPSEAHNVWIGFRL